MSNLQNDLQRLADRLSELQRSVDDVLDEPTQADLGSWVDSLTTCATIIVRIGKVIS